MLTTTATSRIDDVDRVEPPAHADLEHPGIEPRRLEDQQAPPSALYSKNVSAIVAARRLDALERADELAPRSTSAAVDADALAVVAQMRRGEGADALPGGGSIAAQYAATEPLPLVPATVMTGTGGLRASPSRSSTARSRSSPRSIALRMHLRLVGQPLVESRGRGVTQASGRGGLFAGQQAQHGADAVAHLAPVDDHVERAVLEQELAALEALRQGLAHRLLDDARTGEADQRLRLADVDVAEHRETRRHAAGGRVGHHRDERQARLATAA